MLEKVATDIRNADHPHAHTLTPTHPHSQTKQDKHILTAQVVSLYIYEKDKLLKNEKCELQGT